MVISYAYSGNLVSFMTVPKLAMPIDKLDEVLDSGLPWEMVVYGVEVEDAMASGALGLVVKELWEGKIPRGYSPTPQVCIIMIKLFTRVSSFSFKGAKCVQGGINIY